MLGLLSPISILCYVLHAPLWVFSAACVLSVVAGAAELTRRRWWGGIGRLVVGGLCVELLIIVVDLVMGARVGAFMGGGDNRVHLARIRTIIQHGFNNFDPFVAGDHFFSIYHTNLLHSLLASCSQLVRVDQFGVWFTSLALGKLLAVCGVYYMAWCAFERRWVAWVAALFFLGTQGPNLFVIYPNKLCPFWLLPCMIGFAIQACQPPCSWRSWLKLGVGALLLGG